MKNKDIKSYFKNKIISGWRQYLDVAISKTHLGLEGVKLPTPSNIAKALGDVDKFDMWYGVGEVKYTTKETSKDGLKKGKSLQIEKWGIVDNNIESAIQCVRDFNTHVDNYADADFPYVVYDNYIYYVVEHRYTVDSEEMDMFECTTYLCCDKGIKDYLELHITGLRVEKMLIYANVCQYDERFKGYKPANDMLKDLAKLNVYTKAMYTNYYADDVVITFAIRYGEDVDAFLNKLKTVIKRYKGKNIR